MNKRIVLIAVLIAIYIVKQVGLIYLIPSWEAPDEQAHIAYISYLYNEKKIPSFYRSFVTDSIDKSTFLKRHDASFNLRERNYTSAINVGSHPPLYYVFLIPSYWIAHYVPSSFTVMLLRIPNIVFGLLILWIVYLFTKKLFRSDRIALLVSILVGLQPMFSFITAIVNSDALVMLCYLYIMYMGWNILHTKKIPTLWWASMILAASTSPLSKPHLGITSLLITYILYVKTKSIVKSVGGFILSATPFVLWMIYNITTYGTRFIGYVVMNQKPIHGNWWDYPVAFILGKQPIGIWMSFWGIFGWLNVPMQKWIYVLFFLVMGWGIIGWYFRKQKIQLDWFLAFSTTVYLLSILGYDLQYYILSRTLAVQGRYIAFILPVLLWVTIKGLQYYSGTIYKIALLVMLGVFTLGQILMFTTIFYAYRPYFL